MKIRNKLSLMLLGSMLFASVTVFAGADSGKIEQELKAFNDNYSEVAKA